MTNLKKSLIVLITLGNMQQLVPMVETTTSPRPGNNHRGASNNVRYSDVAPLKRSNEITIFGFKAGEHGTYKRKSRTATIGGLSYTVTGEYMPLNSATRLPKISNGTLIAYIKDNDSTGLFGGPNTRVYLYGTPYGHPDTSNISS